MRRNRRWSEGHHQYHRRCQGLHNESRQGTLPDRARRRDRRADKKRRRRVRYYHRTSPQNRLVRRCYRPPLGKSQRSRQPRYQQARHSRKPRQAQDLRRLQEARRHCYRELPAHARGARGLHSRIRGVRRLHRGYLQVRELRRAAC